MNPIARATLLGAVVVIGLSTIPVAAVTGSYLATHAVSAAMRKAHATPPDFLTLAAAPKPKTDDFGSLPSSTSGG